MFTLGDSVNYIRQRGGAVLEGQGVVRGLVLDHTGRRVAAIHDSSQPRGHEVFNVDVLAVNPSPEFKAKFRELVAKIMALSEEGNKAAAAAVEKYNAQIDAAYNALLGEPLSVAELFLAGHADAANDAAKAA